MSKKVNVVYYKERTKSDVLSKWHSIQFFGSMEGALRFRNYASKEFLDCVFRVVSFDLLTLDDAKCMIEFNYSPFPSCNNSEMLPDVDALLRS